MTADTAFAERWANGALFGRGRDDERRARRLPLRRADFDGRRD